MAGMILWHSKKSFIHLWIVGCPCRHGGDETGLWSGWRDSNPRRLAWEASTLPLSYTRPNRIYFNPKNHSCKGGVLASLKFATDIGSLLHGYQLCAATEGKSPNTIAIIMNSVRYLHGFLSSNGLSTDVTQIGTEEIRAFILHLQQKRCFSNHPYSKVQEL